MSNNPSKTTKAVACRIPNDIYNIMVKRAAKREITISEHIKRLVLHDATRKH